MNTTKIIIIAAASYVASMAARCFTGSLSNSTARRRSAMADRADGKSKDLNRGDNQRSDIDRAVLPQFAPHRPIDWPSRGSIGARSRERGVGRRFDRNA